MCLMPLTIHKTKLHIYPDVIDYIIVLNLDTILIYVLVKEKGRGVLTQ